MTKAAGAAAEEETMIEVMIEAMIEEVVMVEVLEMVLSEAETAEKAKEEEVIQVQALTVEEELQVIQIVAAEEEEVKLQILRAHLAHQVHLALQAKVETTTLSLQSLQRISIRMLSISQKALLEDKIKQNLETLTDDISYLEEATKPIAPENAIGRISRIDAINNKSVAEQSLRQAKDKQGKLLEALDNITNSDFGNCQKCKEEIAFERLLFMPESRRCMKCLKQC